MTAVAAAIPQTHTDRAEVAFSNDTIAELSKSRVVFFAGDVIPDVEKYADATKAFGGIFLPQFKTLHHYGNKGMVYRCKLTVMQLKMRREPARMINPAELPSWDTSFTMQRNRYNPVTNQWEDEVITGDGYMVFKPNLYPGKEVLRIVQRTPPNGVGGVVEITALKGATREEVQEAQLFYFPEWNDIENGNKMLPYRMAELEAHLRERQNAVRSMPWDVEKKRKFLSIGADMVKSCAEYRQFGAAYLKWNEDKMNEAKVKGNAYSYPNLAEDLLVQLDLKRKDDLASGNNDQMSALLDLQRRQLELEERKLALEEARLRGGVPQMEVPDGFVESAVADVTPETYKEAVGALEATDPAADYLDQLDKIIVDVPNTLVTEPDVPAASDTSEVVTGSLEAPPGSVALCGAPTANGACARVPKEGETRCWQHPVEKPE